MKKEYVEMMKKIIPDEIDEYISSLEKNVQRGIHINNNKISTPAFLNINCFPVEKIPVSDNLYYLNTDEKIGRHPFHHAGMVYLQDPSAMLPAKALKMKKDWRVLDLCSAPGGKAIQLAEVLTDGLLVANEKVASRSHILFSNIERMGFSNTVILNNDPSELANNFGGFFDCILVDAPCSGEGMFRKDAEAMKMWSEELVLMNSKRQKDILDNAHTMLKEGGYLIYSTCTFSYEENEENVLYMKDKYGYEICDLDKEVKEITQEGLIDKARRFYPHLGLGEGQFISLMKKTQECESKYRMLKIKKENLKVIKEFINEYMTDCDINIHRIGNAFYHFASDVDLSMLNVVSYGVYLGLEVKGRFSPEHNLFTAFGKYFKSRLDLDFEDMRVSKYLRGEEIKGLVDDGFGVLMIHGCAVGGYKAKGGVLKNYYPKGLRNF